MVHVSAEKGSQLSCAFNVYEYLCVNPLRWQCIKHDQPIENIVEYQIIHFLRQPTLNHSQRRKQLQLPRLLKPQILRRSAWMRPDGVGVWEFVLKTHFQCNPQCTRFCRLLAILCCSKHVLSRKLAVLAEVALALARNGQAPGPLETLKLSS